MAAKSCAGMTSSLFSAISPAASDAIFRRVRPVLSGWLLLMSFWFPISIAFSGITFFPLIGLYLLLAPWTFKIWPPSWGRIETAFAVFWGLSIVSSLAGLAPAHSI